MKLENLISESITPMHIYASTFSILYLLQTEIYLQSECFAPAGTFEDQSTVHNFAICMDWCIT
jgi:hypothetical protein